MQRYSRLWWASILLSSLVTGGGSFVLLTLATELPTETVIKVSVILILVGDIGLAFIMGAVSPTRVTLGPGDRLNKADLPTETGTVIDDFEDGHGSVSIRGERWRARQTATCSVPLTTGAVVRVLDRHDLTLVVAATNPHSPA